MDKNEIKKRIEEIIKIEVSLMGYEGEKLREGIEKEVALYLKGVRDIRIGDTVLVVMSR